MCVGTMCAFLRTGGDVPVERAVVKLEALALGFLHSRDPYSYLLARLTAASARRFIETCLWPQIDKLRLTSSGLAGDALTQFRSEEHTSELQSLMRIPYAVLCLTKQNKT